MVSYFDIAEYAKYYGLYKIYLITMKSFTRLSKGSIIGNKQTQNVGYRPHQV